MWRGFLLLLICAAALGIVAMFGQSWQTSVIAIALVAFAIGYLNGIGNESTEE